MKETKLKRLDALLRKLRRQPQSDEMSRYLSVRSCASLGLALAFSMSSSPVLAGSIIDAAANAEALMEKGERVEAVFALDAAIGSLWNEIGLTFTETLFVSDRPKSYGVFSPRPTNIFAPGEEMQIYVEMVGYGFSTQDSFYEAELSADTEVRSAAGEVIGGQEDFVTFNHKARVPFREFFAVITYEFGGLAPGEYVVSTKLKDKNLDQWASFDLPFVIE